MQYTAVGTWNRMWRAGERGGEGREMRRPGGVPDAHSSCAGCALRRGREENCLLEGQNGSLPGCMYVSWGLSYLIRYDIHTGGGGGGEGVAARGAG